MDFVESAVSSQSFEKLSKGVTEKPLYWRFFCFKTARSVAVFYNRLLQFNVTVSEHLRQTFRLGHIGIFI